MPLYSPINLCSTLKMIEKANMKKPAEHPAVAMLRSEIEIMMSDREALLLVAGAAAKLVEKI